MSRPGTHRFIGPLTPAQRRRRERARETFRVVSDIAYARNVSMREAFALWKEGPIVSWSPMRGDSYP